MRQPEYLYLHEMRDAVVRIIDIVGTSSRAEIEQDRNRADALMRNYTVLGEAAAGLPQEFRDRHADIAWRRPIGLRNRIVHGYWSIDMEILVVTAANDLPDLLTRLNGIMSALEPGASEAHREGCSAGSWRCSPARTTCVPLDHGGPTVVPGGGMRVSASGARRRPPPRSARSPGNRRARHLTREHVTLADVLAN